MTVTAVYLAPFGDDKLNAKPGLTKIEIKTDCTPLSVDDSLEKRAIPGFSVIIRCGGREECASAVRVMTRARARLSGRVLFLEGTRRDARGAKWNS